MLTKRERAYRYPKNIKLPPVLHHPGSLNYCMSYIADKMQYYDELPPDLREISRQYHGHVTKLSLQLAKERDLRI